MNRIAVKDVQVVDWESEGHFQEGSFLPAVTFYVLAHLVNGEVLVHHLAYVNSYEQDDHGFYYPERTVEETRELAEAFAERVRERGDIDPRHWYEHSFFSRDLEERLEEEAYHEELHRRGYGHLSNGAFSGGHE